MELQCAQCCKTEMKKRRSRRLTTLRRIS